jgi:hypothetical protein
MSTLLSIGWQEALEQTACFFKGGDSQTFVSLVFCLLKVYGAMSRAECLNFMQRTD